MSAALVLRTLQRLEHGRLEVGLPGGERRAFGGGGAHADLEVRNRAAFSRILRAGDIGFAEGYLDGDWTTSNLPRLLTLLAANREPLEKPLYGSFLGRIANRLLHLARANTRTGSRRNIAAHYDLGNAFYALWLDASMTYSSALYEGDAGRALGAAQQAKLARALERLELGAGARLLEIGCGWGSFAELAATQGHHVTGLTLSAEQLAYARRRLGAAAAIELRDYRDERGRYDAVVSIEMIEAVGERWWPAYFGKIAEALPAGGRALVQAIVIRDDLFARYRTGTDFIQKYVFPGGMLPSPARFEFEAAAAGLRVAEAHRFGPDYARTLAEWRRRFLGRWEEARALGYDERFRRLWEFYLAYCEAGFATGSTDVVQYLLVKR
ncbi:MAG TPA: cyclopropane-fatty-acyl-phospholipid synthase family protein [Burkholderiales bacterium]|jgi:cyclopropane-fatty-acyl-phospholipid synthase|nr:cyclopropane-fatty-acyl-phospholipid synthase family protein [Burkholderiales bacterium]